MAACRRCGRPIRWVMLYGVRVPVDVAPARDGTVELQAHETGRLWFPGQYPDLHREHLKWCDTYRLQGKDE